MKVQFLGTSASPSMPLPFCQCKVCVDARRIRGKNLRKRSSALINSDMIIDIGPDIMSSSYAHNIDITNVSTCLQTHCHEDHFDPEIIISRHIDYGSVIFEDLHIVGSKQTLEMMDVIIGRRCGYGSIFNNKVQSDLRIKLMPIIPYKQYTIGNYVITGFPANHGSRQEGCLIYSLEYNDKCLFYATDTSVIFDEVWEHLNTAGMKFDLVILDHTYGTGFESKPGDHLAANEFINHVQRIINNNLLKNNGQIFATHLSHEGILEHSELVKYASKHNYNIAYEIKSI